MSNTAVLKVDILADATKATKGFDAAAKSADKASDSIKHAGDSAGDSATGLSALSGALDAAGFGGAASALSLVATGLDAAEGSTILYKVATEEAGVATKAWAGIQAAFNAVMSANPVAIVILAVVALIAVIVVIATKTTWFQQLWALAWKGIKIAAAALWSWLAPVAKVAFKLITLYVQLWVEVAKLAWAIVKGAAKALWDWLAPYVQPVFRTLGRIIDAFVVAWGKAWDGIKRAAAKVWDWIGPIASSTMAGITGLVDGLADAWDAVVEAVKKVLAFIDKIKIPNLSGLNPFKSGGTGVTGVGPTTRAAGSTTSGGGGLVINVNGALDPVGVARQIRQILADDDRRRGGVRLGIVT